MLPYVQPWIEELFARVIHEKGLPLEPLQQRNRGTNAIRWSIELSDFGETNTLTNPVVSVGKIIMRLVGPFNRSLEAQSALQNFAHALVSEAQGLEVEGAFVGVSFIVDSMRTLSEPQNAHLNKLGELQLGVRVTLFQEREAA